MVIVISWGSPGGLCVQRLGAGVDVSIRRHTGRARLKIQGACFREVVPRGPTLIGLIQTQTIDRPCRMAAVARTPQSSQYQTATIAA
jgi:hypothetical protein